MLKKLVQSLYSAFDKDPHGVVALRISHASGASWSVQNRTLTLSASGLPDGFEIPLSDINFSELAILIEDFGFEIPFLNYDLQALSAFSLLDGAGDESSGSDALSAYTSTLWGLLDAVAAQLEFAGGQIDEAIAQISLLTASAEYLDEWGASLGVQRLAGMSDADYRNWIITEASQLRLSPGGIAQAVKGATGYTITIREPWMDIFKLDNSVLSGGDSFYDGNLIDYHTIQPEAFGYVDWERALPVIHRNRAAGIGVLSPRNHYAFAVDASDVVCVFTGHLIFEQSYSYPDVPLLSYMEISDEPILNNPLFHVRNIRIAFASDAPNPTVNLLKYRSFRDYFYSSTVVRYTWLTVDSTWSNHNFPWPRDSSARPAAHTRS